MLRAMLSTTHLLQPRYCTGYWYASDNIFEKHFFVRFAVHVQGPLRRRLSFWEWLLGAPEVVQVDERLRAAYYKQRSHWYRLNGEQADIEEETALHAVKYHIDRLLGARGEPKFVLRRQGLRQRWPQKKALPEGFF
jgi:hypothetical protein